MTEESFWITNRFGEKLEAILRKPDENGSFPTVIFVSGFGMDFHEYINSYDEISRHLVANGMLTFQFSFAGRGKSEGDYTKMTLERQAEQIADVVTWLQAKRDIQKAHIGFIAQSFGCPTAMTYLASIDHKRLGLSGMKGKDPIKAVCFVSGVYFLITRFQTKIEKQRISVHKDDVTLFLDPFDNEIPVGPDFWNSIHAFDPLKKASAIEVPLFMIHGEKDRYIQAENPQIVFDAFGSKQKQFKSFQNGDHGITDVPREMREEFLGDVVEWFKHSL